MKTQSTKKTEPIIPRHEISIPRHEISIPRHEAIISIDSFLDPEFSRVEGDEGLMNRDLILCLISCAIILILAFF